MTVTLLQGDCLSVLKTLAAYSVQTCVTSPPYFGLRDYGTARWGGGDPDCDHNPQHPDGGERADRAVPLGRGGLYRDVCGKCGAVRIDEQIGLEETPEAYVNRLVEVFREVRRVLKDDGTLWLNLGDSYASNGDRASLKLGGHPKGCECSYCSLPNKGLKTRVPEGLKQKDLIGIPWMVAFALRADGWYLRSEIIWHKPNPMPESVRDRPTKAHEQIFLLSKSLKYFYDAEAVREPAEWTRKNIDKRLESKSPKRPSSLATGQTGDGHNGAFNSDGSIRAAMSNGVPARNRRSVWTVTTKPYKEAHFATFPPDLIEPCILAGTSEKGECPKCGKAWVRVTERVGANVSNEEKIREHQEKGIPRTTANLYATKERGHTETIGWEPGCNCIDESDHNGPFEPVPQIVLDPFSGSGTTGAVAIKHGRGYIGIELNPAYIELTHKRLNGLQMVTP